jgi:hypothetical protein
MLDIIIYFAVFLFYRKSITYKGRNIIAFVVSFVAAIAMIALPQPVRNAFVATPVSDIISPFDANETSFNISPLAIMFIALIPF